MEGVTNPQFMRPAEGLRGTFCTFTENLPEEFNKQQEVGFNPTIKASRRCQDSTLTL